MKVYEDTLKMYVVRDTYGNISYVSTNEGDANSRRQWNEWVCAQSVTLPVPEMEE